MPDLIAQLRRDMRDRLKAIDRELAGVEGLIEERHRIEQALAQPPFADGRPTAAKGTSARKSRTRAPRGANREAILSAVRDRPGATASEIADATKIGRRVVYATASKLIGQGLLAKESLPGGQAGYRIVQSPAPASGGADMGP